MRHPRETAARMRERLRDTIDVEQHLACVVECAKRLQEGQEPITHPITRERQVVPIDGPRVSALSKAADIHLRLVDRVLPALKAVELSGADGAPLDLSTPDRLVLRTKLLALVREEEAEQEEREGEQGDADGDEEDLPDFLR